MDSFKEEIGAIMCYAEYLGEIEAIKCYSDNLEEVEAIKCYSKHLEEIEAIQCYIEHLEEIKFNLEAMHFYIMYLQDRDDKDSIIKETIENFMVRARA